MANHDKRNERRGTLVPAGSLINLPRDVCLKGEAWWCSANRRRQEPEQMNSHAALWCLAPDRKSSTLHATFLAITAIGMSTRP
jgi:hypothetical protein